MMTLDDDLAFVNLIDEDTNAIQTDDANKEIQSNMTMHVAPNFLLMQDTSPGGQISNTN